MNIDLLGEDFAGSPFLLYDFSFEYGGFIEALIDFQILHEVVKILRKLLCDIEHVLKDVFCENNVMFSIY